MKDPSNRAESGPAKFLRSSREIESLAGDVAELARSDPKRLSERVAALSIRDQAELALRIPARERLELLLHAPAPMRLVRSLPDAELHLTVREVGPSDALTLLSLASSSQILHLMDLESWRRDRFDADRAGAWVALLLEGGEATAVRFLRNCDDEVLTLLFARWARASEIEVDDTPEVHGPGETEAGTEEGFVSPDGVFRFSPTIPEHRPAVRRLAELLFADRPERYSRILWATQAELLDEVEEQAFHWRQSRLEEHGFPVWEESLSIYAQPTRTVTPAQPPPADDPDSAPAPRAALRVLAGKGLLPAVVERLEGPTGDAVLQQFAALANRILVADSLDAGDLDSHAAAVEKAAAYVGIALAARGAATPADAERVIASYPLVELFREGYGRAAALAERAHRLVTTGWASAAPDALDLLDVPIRPRIQGLLRPRPLYYEPSTKGKNSPYREFRSLEEIEETRVSVDLAEVLGRILVDRMGLDVRHVLSARMPGSGEPPRFSTLFLTLMAWHAARGNLSGAPVPADVAATFVRNVASHRTAPAEAPASALEVLLTRLAAEASLDPREVSALRAFLRACLDRLEEECGALDPAAGIDPRYVSCLLIEA